MALRLALVAGAAPLLVACGTDAAPSGMQSASGGESSGIAGQSAGTAGTGGSVDARAAGGAPQTSGGTANGAPAGSSGMDASSRAGAQGHDSGAADGGAPIHDGGAMGSDGAVSASYVCSLILGIATTNEWFGGFEKVVDNARWELKFQDSAHIEKWADPANAVWSLPITSPCAKNADAPDRVVFMGTNYDYDTVELFLPKYVAVWNNIKAKYPTVKHLDVMTYTRAPGDQECVGAMRPNDSYIKPAQDEAIVMFAAMYPGIVVPTPRWEVQSCSDFTLCPHLTGAANAVISKTIGTYFLTH
jgi:hypothetical protein